MKKSKKRWKKQALSFESYNKQFSAEIDRQKGELDAKDADLATQKNHIEDLRGQLSHARGELGRLNERVAHVPEHLGTLLANEARTSRGNPSPKAEVGQIWRTPWMALAEIKGITAADFGRESQVICEYIADPKWRFAEIVSEFLRQHGGIKPGWRFLTFKEATPEIEAINAGLNRSADGGILFRDKTDDYDSNR